MTDNDLRQAIIAAGDALWEVSRDAEKQSPAFFDLLTHAFASRPVPEAAVIKVYDHFREALFNLATLHILAMGLSEVVVDEAGEISFRLKKGQREAAKALLARGPQRPSPDSPAPTVSCSNSTTDSRP